jgi:FKBP-type peptidyl-prolyl cis-trans isomerase FklB
MKNKFFIKLLFLALLTTTFWGCEKEYYDTKNAGENALAINAKKDSVDLTYDSTYTNGTDTLTKTISKRAALHVLSDGLQYAFYYGNSYGDYSRPETTTYVKLNYTGKFINGTSFVTGTNTILTYSNLISGLQEIIRKMNTGSKCRVWIPYSLGYGSSGSTNTDGSYLVDPYSALVYDVELLVATD